MGRHDHVKPTGGTVQIQIDAFETEIGETKVLRPLSSEGDGGR